MSSFSYANKEQQLYLYYTVDVNEQIKKEKVKILTSSKLHGITQTEYCEDENGKYFKYNVHSLITLKELLTKDTDDITYCNILHSVALTLEILNTEGLGTESLVLNEELIYYDTMKKVVNFICIPTSNFINTITAGQILHEFSKLIINRMGASNNLILELNTYLATREFDNTEFNCLINSIIMNSNANKNIQLTKREYSEEEIGGNIDKESLFKKTTLQIKLKLLFQVH